MRVLIVDNHRELRRSIRGVLTDAFEGAVFGEAENAAQALRLAQSELWDAVILDLSLPDAHGLETLKQLRQLRPALPVLVMSMHPESHYGPSARAAGACAYLVKGSDAAEIVTAVRQAVPRRG
jgi:two-component system, NarL family, invasion response regulator UvrY